MPDVSQRQVGAQFDILDKAVASRYYELNSRQTIARQTYNAFLTDYHQLESYARANSNVPYVARQWLAEEPRYKNVFASLQSRIVESPVRVPYTPALYNSDISISSTSSCKPCCGGGGLAALPGTNYIPGTTTVNQRPGSGTVITSNMPQFPSLGDMLRGLFGVNKPQEVPNIEYPNSPLINESGIFTSIITALIVGAVLYIIHRATKK
ncbi:MAG TPA: hypothetical protein VGO47_14760 [Chlamydiales bacterium]|jgi:hypothetical protein|nr:hypothetical protein [Chlamydiales bacterium]